MARMDGFEYEFMIDKNDLIHILISNTTRIIIHKIDFEENKDKILKVDFDVIGDVANPDYIIQNFMDKIDDNLTVQDFENAAK